MKTLILILLSANVFCQSPDVPEGYGHSYGDTSGLYLPYYIATPITADINTVRFIIRGNNCTVIDSEGYYIIRADQLRNIDTIKTDSDTKLTLPNEEDENDYNIEISDTQLVLGGKYIKGKYFADPQWLDNENLIKDKCGQWWERNIEYGEWEQGKRDKPEFTIYKMEYWENHNLRNCCNYISECKPEYESELKEYRFDPSNKIEYSRTVKVTYKKIEL